MNKPACASRRSTHGAHLAVSMVLLMGMGAAANISVPFNCSARQVTAPVRVDGRLDDEWRGVERVVLRGEPHWRPAREGETYGGPSDAAVRFSAVWDESNLYLAIEAYDNDLVPPTDAANMLQGDCIVVAVDARDDASQGYAEDDSELGFAYTPSGPVAWRWFPAKRAGALVSAKVAVVRQVKPGALAAGQPPIKLTYEIAIPWAELPGKSAPEAGQLLGFDLAVNDVDQAGRHGWLEWTPGIMGIKDPSQFGNIMLIGSAPPLQAASIRSGGSGPRP